MHDDPNLIGGADPPVHLANPKTHLVESGPRLSLATAIGPQPKEIRDGSVVRMGSHDVSDAERTRDQTDDDHDEHDDETHRGRIRRRSTRVNVRRCPLFDP